MPELPEVEHLRRGLCKSLIGRTITRVSVNRADICHLDPACGRLSRSLLQGALLSELKRRGKQMALISADQRVLCVHLGMSGQMFCVTQGHRNPRPDHVHVTWRLDDGNRLVFRDPRRFGGLWTFETFDDLFRVRWQNLGPDALSISTPDLAAHFKNTRRAIKATLLDQSILAGVGNIYADEALFAARIAPSRQAQSLDREEIRRLAAQISRILAQAVRAGGSTFRDYVDGQGQKGHAQLMHRVYGRGTKPCTRCGHPLNVTQIAQRTTVSCVLCQR